MIAQRRRRDGKLELALLGEEINSFLRDFGVEGRLFFKPGKEFAHGSWIEQSSRQAMLADLAGFLQNVNVFFAELRIGMRGVVLINQLRQTQTRRPCLQGHRPR